MVVDEIGEVDVRVALLGEVLLVFERRGVLFTYEHKAEVGVFCEQELMRVTKAFDVYQLRQQEAQIRSTLESARLGQKSLSRRLALLQGKLPSSKADVTTGVPDILPGLFLI